jgi:hypothetical protein
MSETFRFDEQVAANYARHRKLRWLCGIAAAAFVVLLGYILWKVLALIANEPSKIPAGIAIVAAGLGFAFIFISIFSFGIRFLARPPVYLNVVAPGLVFGLFDNTVRVVDWSDPDLDFQVLDRPSDPKVPWFAQYRIWVRGSPADRILPWRRVIPLAYVTQEAALRVVQSAKESGTHIIESADFRPLSILSHDPCHVFDIGPKTASRTFLD